jgi:hypothetical protein
MFYILHVRDSIRDRSPKVGISNVFGLLRSGFGRVIAYPEITFQLLLYPGAIGTFQHGWAGSYYPRVPEWGSEARTPLQQT